MATVKDPGIDLHRQQLRDVERKLAQALQERDDLARDLEAMCLDAEPATFSASSVLRERIFATGEFALPMPPPVRIPSAVVLSFKLA
jgi:hypothetical protein